MICAMAELSTDVIVLILMSLIFCIQTNSLTLAHIMDKELRKEIGKFFVDVAKLLIGGVVLSSVLKIQGLSNALAISLGMFVSIVLAILGFLIMSIKKQNGFYSCM
jgi:hypothetical protein